MSHVFDTGFPFAKRTMLRQSVVTILSALKRPNGYLRSVIPFGAVVRAWTDVEGIELLTKAVTSTPAIAVAIGSESGDETTVGGQRALDVVEVLIYFVSQQSRDLIYRLEPDIAAQADDHADPGLEVAMEHATELLLGQYPVQSSVKLKQLRKVRTDELSTTPLATIYCQTWHCAMTSTATSKEFRDAPQLLSSLHWRTTTNPDEVNRPAPATDSTTIDVNSEL